MMDRSRLTLVWFAAAFLLAIAFSPVADGQTPLTTELVASGFDDPLYLTSPPDDLDRLFVVEQRGKIWIVKDGVTLGAPFIDLSQKVSASGYEQGLLGLSFHPDYRDNGFFYVNYTRASDSATVVERYTVSAANPDLADPASGVVVLGPINQPYNNHNGGCIQFGPDGKLYVGMGDGGSAGDPNCYAQKGNTLLGKLLRINDDGSIPADNPFVGDPDVLDPIWALGLRNPWRFSFDRGTGDLFIADVGQSQREEVDFQPASSAGGENYGWKVMEGSLCFGSGNCPPGTPPCNDPSLTLPIHEYDHSSGKCSITGGYVYRGCAIPDLRGAYFFADYCSAQIWSFRTDGVTVFDLQDRTGELAPGGGRSIDLVTSFGEDADGELYIIDQGGEIFKVKADVPPAYIDLGYAKAGTGGVEPNLDICGLMGSGGTAALRLRDAVPNASALLVVSLIMDPQPYYGGILVPGLPPLLSALVTIDPDGRFSRTFNGGGGPLDLYAQFGILDPGATQGVAFSNAIKATLQP